MTVVEISNMYKIFSTKKIALNNINLKIKRGKITGLIGADGSGKTTLIRLIIGLFMPTKGKITTLGVNPILQRGVINSKIGYMPQKFGLYEDLSVIDNLKLYADLKRTAYDFGKLLNFTHLNKFQDRLAGNLSGGMKQKLGLACALLGEPEFLILDEPSVGVDPISRIDLMNMVKELINPTTSVLWSSTYINEVKDFDETVILNDGKIIFSDNPYKLGKNTEQFEEKIINLMGGYKKGESLIAKQYSKSEEKSDCIVIAENLVKKYGNFYAVKNNSFCIKRGEIFGLLGPNGAGKSTSFKMMCGLSMPTSGTAKIMGIDISKNPSLARSNLGYMAQKFSLYGSLTLRQNLDFFASIYGISFKKRQERIEEIIDIFNFKNIQNQKAKELPLGFKQRLSFATALIHNPSVLFLDEPTSGVDIIAKKEFWAHIVALAKKGVTILVTTHFMDETEYCNRISLFYEGEAIAIGTPLELKNATNTKTMEDAFISLIKRRNK